MDFVFSQLDAFGHLRHMVVQAKHEASLSQGAKLDGLISQIKQAFHVPFVLPSSPTETRYVSAVYVFNTGSITPNACTQIANSLPRELASNTHFFGGDQLEGIYGAVAAADDRTTRARLSSMLLQLQFNVTVWVGHIKALDAGEKAADVREGFIRGLEDFVMSPPVPNKELRDAAFLLWQEALIIRSLVGRLTLLLLSEDDPLRVKDRATLRKICLSALQNAQKLAGLITSELAQLPGITL